MMLLLSFSAGDYNGKTQAFLNFRGGLKPAIDANRILICSPLIETGVFPTEINHDWMFPERMDSLQT